MMFGEVGMVKRLRPRPDGSVVIVSDNKDVADDRATDGDLHVIGRVVAIVKRV
jgi:phage repressor protein C with HTH and peptisase S24 domain